MLELEDQNMRKYVTRKHVVFGFACLVVGVCLGAATTGEYFQASLAIDLPNVANYDYTEVGKDLIHMTKGNDNMRFNAGSDTIWMASENDAINMGPGSDTLDFYSQNADADTIRFTDTNYIQHQNNRIMIYSANGDVVIALGTP
jgi:Ca2+-binding RTX toxin-like protein